MDSRGKKNKWIYVHLPPQEFGSCKRLRLGLTWAKREKLQDGETVVLQKKNYIAAMFFLEGFEEENQSFWQSKHFYSYKKSWHEIKTLNINWSHCLQFLLFCMFAVWDWLFNPNVITCSFSEINFSTRMCNIIHFTQYPSRYLSIVDLWQWLPDFLEWRTPWGI